MAGRLDGKIALVTGGGGGIGEATARRFLEEGAQVAIVDIDADAVQAAAGRLGPGGPGVLPITADMGVDSDARRAVRETVERFGGLDILANVAAVRVYGPLTEATDEAWEYILRANLIAVSYGSKHAIPEMIDRGGGSIVSVSSANATVGRPMMGLYDATKAGVLALTRTLACENADAGIRVNAVSPGPTLTGFHIRRRMAGTGESAEQAEAAIRSRGASNTLLKRQAEPVEIANAILFLASDEASYITGINLFADGGISGLRD